MNKEDEEEVRIAVENNEYVANSYVKELLEEIDLLRYQLLHQQNLFNERMLQIEELSNLTENEIPSKDLPKQTKIINEKALSFKVSNSCFKSLKEFEEAARSEGRADIAVKLRKIIDPKDINHYNIDRSLNHVQKMKDILSLILELDVLKSFAFDPGDEDLSLVDEIKILTK